MGFYDPFNREDDLNTCQLRLASVWILCNLQALPGFILIYVLKEGFEMCTLLSFLIYLLGFMHFLLFFRVLSSVNDIISFFLFELRSSM